jgi:hypothetical protein
MYGSAVECLLYDQGYEMRMLGPKITKAREDRDAGAGPAWLARAPDEVFELLNKVGNGAIHPNDGDISRQEAIDRELLDIAEDMLAGLIDLIYEEPARRAEGQARMAAAAERLRHGTSGPER